MILAAVPILMNEIVPANIRGALVDIHAIMLVLGYTIQGWVGFGFYFWSTGGSNTWRPPMALAMVWPLLLLIGLPFLPESPRWLCMKGRDAEAERLLLRLHSYATDPDNTVAAREFYQIQQQLELERTLGSGWIQMFKKPSYRKRAFLAIGTCGIVQCSGVLVINNYGPTLYRDLGFSAVKQLLYPAAWLTFALGKLMLCSSEANLPSSLPLIISIGANVGGMLIVDRFSRPKYIAFGVLGCMATLIVEAALVANFVGGTNTAALQACVAMFFVFQVFYGICLDGTQFSYLGEIFPTHLRAKGMCLGMSMISLMNIVWLQSAPVAFITIGWKFYLAMIIPGTIGAVCMWLFFPNTKGIPLEEVAAIFGDADEVAVFERELDVDPFTHKVVGVERKGAHIEQKEHVEA